MTELVSNINTWITDHQALVATVAIPLLTLFVTMLSGSASNKRAENTQKSERGLQQALKMADIRTRRIDRLSDEFSKFISIATSSSKPPKERGDDLELSHTKISLLLEFTHVDFKPLMSSMNSIKAASKKGAPDPHDLVVATITAQAFIKKELNRIESDLINESIGR